MIYIKWIKTKEIDEIYFPPNFQEGVFGSLKKINFHFGSWGKELSVQFSEDLSDNQIGLSENIKNDVFIPDDLLYEINSTEDSLSLGPVILYLISKRLFKRIDHIMKRLENIAPFNGLVIISTVSRISKETKTIKGYYYQQKSNSLESNWEEKVFSYPDVVFKRVHVPKKINKHLYEETNGRVFNSKFFNKWEMWKWLSPYEVIRSHIPHTAELNNVAEIYGMLDKYESIYLKPRNGSQGKGIIEIKRIGDSYLVTDDKNIATKVEKIDGHLKIVKVLKRKRKYIIQQGVPVKHDSRNVDFRIYMQKDEKKQWKCSGYIARFAKPDSITTNLHHLDYLLPGKEALAKIFQPPNEYDLELIEQKIVNVFVDACELLDLNGCFGDLAIDFILDKDLHVWILEMNKRYGYKSFSIIKDTTLYGNVIRNPFLYATALAGFNIESKTSEIEKSKE